MEGTYLGELPNEINHLISGFVGRCQSRPCRRLVARGAWWNRDRRKPCCFCCYWFQYRFLLEGGKSSPVSRRNVIYLASVAPLLREMYQGQTPHNFEMDCIWCKTLPEERRCSQLLNVNPGRRRQFRRFVQAKISACCPVDCRCSCASKNRWKFLFPIIV